jgi:hypothetical protein
MTGIDDLRRAVAEDDGSLPERWNPEDAAGATLIGTLLRYETIVTDFGQSQVAVVEDAEDGVVYGVALFRTVLKKRFDALEPRPGDTIGLKYVGLEEPRNKGANAYHNYVLRVMRGASSNGTAATATVSEDTGADDELPF